MIWVNEVRLTEGLVGVKGCVSWSKPRVCKQILFGCKVGYVMGENWVWELSREDPGWKST